MKTAILSDIHGNSPALAAVMAGLSADVQRILFLGDIVGYYPFAAECVDLLAAKPTSSVQGNHDRVALEAMANGNHVPPEYSRRYGDALARAVRALSPAAARFLAEMPVSRTVEICGVRILMVHGTPEDPLEGRFYPDSRLDELFIPAAHDVLLMGNTHYPFQTTSSGILVANPGSVGQPRQGGGNADFAILDTERRTIEPRSVAYDPTPVMEDAAMHNPDMPYLIDVLQRKQK